MNKLFYLLVFISMFGYSQTPITDANFQTAINNCLATNPVDGMCSDSEYGAMPDWDVSQVTDMSNAFRYNSNFNADISAWDVRNVTNMIGMFSFATAFNQDIGTWDVSSVTDMGGFINGMFYSARSFNQDLSNWDVSSVRNMRYMFDNASSFNQDLSSWDVSNVTNMQRMFSEASSFNQDLSSWEVSNVTNLSNFGDGTSISVANYDALLTSWSTLILQQGVNFSNSTLQYCAARDARQSIIDTYGWTITDAGLDCSTLSVEDETQLAISIYPNPTNDKLFIQGLSDATEVSIYNILGKEVISTKNTSNINVKALPKGVYIIRISDGVGLTNRRFIKN